MTYKDLHIAFELEATSKFSNTDETKPTSLEIEYWLNVGLSNWLDSKYTGYNQRLKGFEQDQKRVDDLRKLVKQIKIGADTIDDETYYIDLPNDYRYLVGDVCEISPNKSDLECWKTNSDGTNAIIYTNPIHCTIDTLEQRRSNTLSDHIYSKGEGKPLRVFRGNSIYYYTDGNYKVDASLITYIKEPSRIDIHTNPLSVYNELSDHSINEVIKQAVQSYLENKSNQRLQTFSQKQEY